MYHHQGGARKGKARAGGYRRKNYFGEPLYGRGERQRAGSGSDHPHERGTAAFQFFAVAGSLQRAGVHRHAVAGFHTAGI